MESMAGKILKKFREEERISLRKQAQKLGLSCSYLCDISQGNRKITIPVISRICSAYKYRCVGSDFVDIAKECFDEEIFRRYKLRTHSTDEERAIKDLIYILSGEVL